MTEPSHLTHAPLSLDQLSRSVVSPSHGGVVSFVGVVRDHHAGRRVTGLTYSAYDEMADRACRAIVAEAEADGRVRIALRHRLGDLEVGDAAVIVVAAAAHRDLAFATCRTVIDEVKARVPIWKHERYDDGSTAWVDPTAPTAAT